MIQLVQNPSSKTFQLMVPKGDGGEALGQNWVQESIQDRMELCTQQTIADEFRKRLREDSLVLESGCGLGQWVFYLNDLNIKAIGLDISAAALEAGKNFRGQSSLICGNGLGYPFGNGTFDAVISLGVVEHFVEGPEKALQEIFRILKPGGLLLLTIPIENPIRRLVVHPIERLKTHIKTLLQKRQYVFAEYRYGARYMRERIENCAFHLLAEKWEDFKPPYSIGLYCDFPIFRDKREKWRLNPLGETVRKILDRLSPSLHAGGRLYVAQRPLS